MKNKFGILVLLLLAIGIVVAIVAVQQSTENRQRASQFEDLNSASEITETLNADGTMGPATYLGNFSNALPPSYLGTLDVQVTDPEQSKPSGLPTQAQKPSGSPTPVPNPSFITPTLTTKTSGTPTPTDKDKSGPQEVVTLSLTITKVEVHLARLGIPGAKNGKDDTTGKPSGTPTPKDNQSVNKWETLNIGAPKTFDLVALFKAKAFESLGLTKLANGKYTEIRLYISQATATLPNGIKVTLVLPGRANIVRIVRPFVIDSSKTTALSVDFDAQNSVIKAGDNYLLKPVVAKFNQKNQE